MRTRLTLLAAIAAALAAPAAASAGGWATVEFDPPPDDLAPGEPWRVQLEVLQHGVTPLEGVTPRVIVTPRGGSAEKTFPARATGKPGVYRATVVFASEGTWRYRVDDGFTAVHDYPPVRIGAGANAGRPATGRPATGPCPRRATRAMTARTTCSRSSPVPSPLSRRAWARRRSTGAASRAEPQTGIIAAVADRIAAVVFDNDGLLLDTEEAWTRAEKTLFERHGGTFTLDHKRDLIGSSPATSAAKLEAMLDLPGRGGALVDELHDLVMEEALAGVPPRPGALELVEALRGAGLPVAVASNSAREFVERVLSVAGLLDGHFDVVVTADDVEHPKPAPDLYLAACAALGVEPERAAALEDSATGVAAAVAAGMYVVAVPYFPELPIEGASLTAESLADPRVAEALGLY